MTIVYIAMACGVIAVLYGFVTSRQVLAASPGDAKMQDIAAAIQEGAKAYLGRQYTAIAVVGAIVAVVLALTLGVLSTVGFLIGAVLSGVAGYVGMNISVRANVRTAEAARTSLQGGLTMAFRSGAITGMLVAGLGLLSIAGYLLVSRRHRRPRPRRPRDHRGIDGTGVRRVADLHLRAAGRRHLHQGRGRRRRSGRQGRGRNSGGRPPQPRRDRRQRGRQCRRLCRHGRRPVRNLCRHARPDDGVGRAADADVGPAVRTDGPPADRRGRVHHHLYHRHLHGPPGQRQHHGRAVQGVLDHRDPRRARHLFRQRLYAG